MSSTGIAVSLFYSLSRALHLPRVCVGELLSTTFSARSISVDNDIFMLRSVVIHFMRFSLKITNNTNRGLQKK